MKKTVLLALLTAITIFTIFQLKQAQNNEFQAWKEKYGVTFKPQQEEYRKMIFEMNLKVIQRHNSDSSQTYKMGINQFSIYSDTEFVELYLATTPQPSSNEISPLPKIKTKNTLKEGDIDWTTKGKVSRVRDQGKCNAGWAFASAGTLQSFFLLKDQPVDLSEQQLVDCTVIEKNLGCRGGQVIGAMRYMWGYGISSEQEYPYIGQDSKSCKRSGGKYRFDLMNPSYECPQMISDLNDQPIAVTVDATKWKSYEGGIFNNCSATLNHAVLLVGVIQGNWKVRNSWGTDWGENGFMRLAPGNTCGICVKAGYYPG